MATLEQVMKRLKSLGTESTRKTLMRHGAPGDIYGVKIGDLKPLVRELKGQQELALALYATGNHDAMYLAGLVANGAEMTRQELESWARSSVWSMHAEHTVPSVVVESPHAVALARKWIKANDPLLAATGWNTYSGILATRPDDELDLDEVRQLLDQVAKGVKTAPNRIRYAMNNFVISVGAYIAPLLKAAKRVAKELETIEVDMGETSCKVPPMLESIEKIEQMGRVGKKRKTMKC